MSAAVATPSLDNTKRSLVELTEILEGRRDWKGWPFQTTRPNHPAITLANLDEAVVSKVTEIMIASRERLAIEFFFMSPLSKLDNHHFELNNFDREIVPFQQVCTAVLSWYAVYYVMQLLRLCDKNPMAEEDRKAGNLYFYVAVIDCYRLYRLVINADTGALSVVTIGDEEIEHKVAWSAVPIFVTTATQLPNLTGCWLRFPSQRSGTDFLAGRPRTWPEFRFSASRSTHCDKPGWEVTAERCMCSIRDLSNLEDANINPDKVEHSPVLKYTGWRTCASKQVFTYHSADSLPASSTYPAPTIRKYSLSSDLTPEQFERVATWNEPDPVGKFSEAKKVSLEWRHRNLADRCRILEMFILPRITQTCPKAAPCMLTHAKSWFVKKGQTVAVMIAIYTRRQQERTIQARKQLLLQQQQQAGSIVTKKNDDIK